MLNCWRGLARFLSALENNTLTVTILQFFVCFSLHDPVKLQISWHHLHFIQALCFTGFIKYSQ